MRLACLLLMFAGCDYVTDTTTTGPLKLSQLEAHVAIAVDADQLELAIVTDDCDSLDPSITAQLDGVPATVHRDGQQVSSCEDFGHCGDPPICMPPKLTWFASSAASGATIAITDGNATWNIAIDHGLARTFELVEPASATLHSGDVVTARLAPQSGTLQGPTARVAGVFDASVTIQGTDLMFTVPQITTAAMAKLAIAARVDLAVTTCDAPRGCTAPIDVSALLPVSLAP